jgi:hypothetical protein
MKRTILKIIIIFFTCSCSLNEYYCEQDLKEFTDENYTGRVLKKYEDRTNHGAETFTWRFSERIGEIAFLSLAHKQQLYDAVEAGDSIYNEAGSAKFYIYRNNTLVKVVELSCSN